MGQALYQAETQGFGKSLAQVEFGTPDWATLAELRYNAYVFSAFKNHSFMGDLVQALVDGDQIRSFSDFKRIAEGISQNYYTLWLEAEYETAIGTGQMAARWQEFQEDKDIYPFLQYQTVGDDRVRDDHRVLDGVTYAIDDPFWDSFMPPNGWRCRCDVIQVAGPAAPADELPELPPAFNHNPGSTMRIATEEHPYFQGLSPEKIDSIKTLTASEVNMPARMKKYQADIDPVLWRVLRNKPDLQMRKNLSGSSYTPSVDKVSISTGKRWESSRLQRRTVIYHEMGHAAHTQRNLITKVYVDPRLESVYQQCRQVIAGRELEIQTSLRELRSAVQKLPTSWEFQGLSRYDYAELMSATADTLEAITSGNWGWGHGRSYYRKISNVDRMEWFAHAMENRFEGNRICQEIMPDVYELMISYIRSIE